MLSFTNIMGTLTAIITVILGVMTQVAGCALTTPDGVAATCSATWLPPAWSVWVAVAFGAITFISKLIRPGGPLASLFGATAVVVPASSAHSTAGTATPEHVAAP